MSGSARSGRRLRGPLLGLLLGGCLLGGRAPEPARYFRPELPARSQATLNGVSMASERAPALRLHRVTALAHLTERIVWRTSEVEIGYYETRRWTELPAHYVEQMLATELFEVRGIKRASAGRTHSLRLELLAFEEALAPRHEARVALRVRLADARRVSRLERSFRTTEAIATDDPLAATRAIGQALARLIVEVADAVLVALPDPSD